MISFNINETYFIWRLHPLTPMMTARFPRSPSYCRTKDVFMLKETYFMLQVAYFRLKETYFMFKEP
jgi:hypothetical protein